MHKGEELGKQRLDMVIDDCIVIEIKSTYDLPKSATRQVFNYLRATDLKGGQLFGRVTSRAAVASSIRLAGRGDLPIERDA
jgi:GxxExxY protein